MPFSPLGRGTAVSTVTTSPPDVEFQQLTCQIEGMVRARGFVPASSSSTSAFGAHLASSAPFGSTGWVRARMRDADDASIACVPAGFPFFDHRHVVPCLVIWHSSVGCRVVNDKPTFVIVCVHACCSYPSAREHDGSGTTPAGAGAGAGAETTGEAVTPLFSKRSNAHHSNNNNNNNHNHTGEAASSSSPGPGVSPQASPMKAGFRARLEAQIQQLREVSLVSSISRTLPPSCHDAVHSVLALAPVVFSHRII